MLPYCGNFCCFLILLLGVIVLALCVPAVLHALIKSICSKSVPNPENWIILDTVSSKLCGLLSLHVMSEFEFFLCLLYFIYGIERLISHTES